MYTSEILTEHTGAISNSLGHIFSTTFVLGSYSLSACYAVSLTFLSLHLTLLVIFCWCTTWTPIWSWRLKFLHNTWLLLWLYEFSKSGSLQQLLAELMLVDHQEGNWNTGSFHGSLRFNQGVLMYSANPRHCSKNFSCDVSAPLHEAHIKHPTPPFQSPWGGLWPFLGRMAWLDDSFSFLKSPQVCGGRCIAGVSAFLWRACAQPAKCTSFLHHCFRDAKGTDVCLLPCLF